MEILNTFPQVVVNLTLLFIVRMYIILLIQKTALEVQVVQYCFTSTIFYV